MKASPAPTVSTTSAGYAGIRSAPCARLRTSHPDARPGDTPTSGRPSKLIVAVAACASINSATASQRPAPPATSSGWPLPFIEFRQRGSGARCPDAARGQVHAAVVAPSGVNRPDQPGRCGHCVTRGCRTVPPVRPGLRELAECCSARPARLRRSPELQCQSGRPALGSSRPRLRTPASGGIPRNLQVDETVTFFARRADQQHAMAGDPTRHLRRGFPTEWKFPTEWNLMATQRV